MDLIQPVHVLTVLGALGLPTLAMLWKIVRALARMEMKMDMLWQDYQERIEDSRLHTRSGIDRRQAEIVTP